MSKQILQTIDPRDWHPKGSGFNRTRWLQDLSDVISRPQNNRVAAPANAAAVNLNGAVQSTGIGTGAATPARYSEFLIHARATFNISGAGALYIFVYRTKGNVPANGSAPNAGDVAVAGDAFGGPATVGGQNMQAALSFIDGGLSASQAYKYYFAFSGTNGLIGNLLNSSQLVASEF